VADCYEEGGWTVEFRRSFTSRDAELWHDLLDMLKDMSLGDSAQDELEWALDKSKNFTTKSLYRFLNHRGVIIANSKNMWKTKLPLKVKIFVWQLSNNKLQAAVSLKKRGWKGDIHCCLCEGGVENVDLIFFGCSIAQFVWCVSAPVSGGQNPPHPGVTCKGAGLPVDRIFPVDSKCLCLQAWLGASGDPGIKWRLRKRFRQTRLV
jgi:hypothetical protein